MTFSNLKKNKGSAFQQLQKQLEETTKVGTVDERFWKLTTDKVGNGYAITAIIGKRDIMDYAQESFISSTFWTERIGPSAALATIDFMEKNKSWKNVKAIGKKIQRMVTCNFYGIFKYWI